MRWTVLLACALVLAPLTGCASPDDEEGYEVAWETEPEDASVGETVEMSWSVDGPEGEIPHTGVHYAETSADDPESPADYGNTSGAVEPAEVPGTFDTDETFDEPGTYYVRSHAIVGEGEHRWSEEVEIEITDGGDGGGGGYEVAWETEPGDASTNETVAMTWQVDGPEGEIPHTGVHWADFPVEDPQSPADYGNTSGAEEPAQVPGTFDTEITFERAGTYYVRAHAIVGEDEHRWSEEVAVEITEADAGAENHPVTIENFAFQPSELEVEPGDQITWENQDGVTHTATFDNETLGDSGDIEPGESYTMTVPEDVEPGTYDYICEYHATMEASITVADGDGG